MKKKLYVVYLLAIVFVGLNLLNTTHWSEQKANQIVAEQFRNGLDEFRQVILKYQNVANELSTDNASIEALKAAHLETRLAFKSIEVFLEYYDHESIKNFVNGAPLLSLEPKVPEIRVLEPVGLQVLDEVVFGENPAEEKEEIVALVDDLVFNFRTIYNYQSGITVSHRHIFEAIRQELIRVFTLGVTGFDTPGSVNAIPEALEAFQSMKKAILPYKGLIEGEDGKLSKSILASFDEATAYLSDHQDFDAFDRMHFLKAFVNPLYSSIYRAQRAIGVETVDEVTKLPQSVNYHEENIFSPDLLNVNYFTHIDSDPTILEKRTALGKLLFYDPILSENNERACASCHNPDKGFTDGLEKSMALNMIGHIQRNSPTIINAVFSERYFYDLREEDLERQTRHVVFDSKEFNTDFFEIIAKLEQSEEYVDLFNEAYPKYKLSAWSVSNSLVSFVTSLRGFDSPVDQYIRGERTQLSESAIRGFNLFMGKAACGTCHFAPTFNGTVPPLYKESESEVLGVPANTDQENPVLDPDYGRAGSGVPEFEADFYIHSFKTTTVRNVALTAPYMHNGVYKTLEEVVDFYNKGGGLGLGMDVPYQTLPDAPLNLTDQEQRDLVIFMEHLTDTTNMTAIPEKLPAFAGKPEWNSRKIGGVY